MAAFAQVARRQEMVRSERLVERREQEVARSLYPQVLVGIVQNDDLGTEAAHELPDAARPVFADGDRRFGQCPFEHQGFVARAASAVVLGNFEESFRAAAVSPAQESRAVALFHHPARQQFGMGAFSRPAGGKVADHEDREAESPAPQQSLAVKPRADAADGVPKR